MSSNEPILGTSPELPDASCAIGPQAPWLEPRSGPDLMALEPRSGPDSLAPVPGLVPRELPEAELPLEPLRGALEHRFSEARDLWIEAFERTYVRRLLERHGRNVAAAAATAGVDRTYIYRLMRRHGL